MMARGKHSSSVWRMIIVSDVMYACGVFFAFPQMALARASAGGDTANQNPLTSALDHVNFVEWIATGKFGSDPDLFVGSVITALLSLVGVIFFALMVYGGYLWMTARGEKDQLDKAKQTIIAATIGIAITLAAYAISAFVVGKLVTAGGLE